MLTIFARQWRGEAPFWLSVLVFSLLLPWAAVIGGTMWLSVYTLDATAYGSLTAAAIVFALIGCVAVWQLVGTWRATSKTKAPGRSLFTRWLGRTVALASFLLVAFAFVSLPGNLASYYAEATDADWIGQKGHSLAVDGDQIVVSGYMSWGLHDEFAAALKDNPGVTTVVLNSPGGHYAVGLRMGRLIRAHSLDTLTTEMCGSACTFAFLGGNKRMLQEGAKLGFHAMAGNTPLILERMQGHASEMLKSADVPDAFVTRVFATPSEDVWYPTVRELRDANVITDVVD